MIYLDNNATSLLDFEVKKEMVALLEDSFLGNPSSVHRMGQRAKNLLNTFSYQISQFFHVNPEELVFTSGATEALNMIIKGLKIEKGHIISSAFEHFSVIHPLQHREKEGYEVTYLKPSSGKISLNDVQKALKRHTQMIVLMAVNNETGIKNEIEEIAKFAEQNGIPFIVDGVALLGKELFHIPSGVSAICFSGHKIHGPTGIGLAIIKRGIKYFPLIAGGNQQRGKRSGTENLIAIAGFAKALDQVKKNLPKATVHMEKLRNRFEEKILSRCPEAIIHGRQEKRICNVSNISFPHLDGETLLMQLDLNGVFVSHGAACSSGGLESSHVLLNMQLPPEQIHSSLRFSLSRFTTEEEIDQAVNILASIENAHFAKI